MSVDYNHKDHLRLRIYKEEVINNVNQSFKATTRSQKIELLSCNSSETYVGDNAGIVRGKKSLSIHFIDKERTKRIIIPEKITIEILDYLQNEKIYQSQREFDCQKFIEKIIQAKVRVIDTRKRNESEITVGNIIVLRKKNRKPKHVAMYLGHGQYLSKFGTQGHLIAETLEEMKKKYRADHIVKAYAVK